MTTNHTIKYWRNDMSDKKTEKTEKAAASADNTAMAAWILRTVQQVLHDTADNRDELPPGTAGSMGMMLCIAMDLLDCSPKSALKTSLGDVAHILGAAFMEKTKVSPTISAACADIIKHIIEGGDTAAGSGCSCSSCGKCSGSAREDERGRKYVATIPAPPDLADAGIDTIELWEDRPISAEMKDNAIRATRAAAELMKDVDGLKDEAAGLMELVAMGGLKDDKTRKQILAQVVKLLHEVAAMKKNVDALEQGNIDKAAAGEALKKEVEDIGKERDAMAKEDKPAAKPESPTIKHIAITDKNGKKKVVSAIDGNAKCYTGTEDKPEPKKAKVSKSKPADGTAEVSGYFTPEETAKLIEDIRAWLSECREGHRLGDLINSIEYCFKLSDGQLGELIGVSSRLVCKVRHGRPSPFTLARFTEVFGTDGGAGTRDEVSGSARTQKEA